VARPLLSCLVLICAAGVTALAGCGDGGAGERSTLERIREEGTVRIAIANEPPLTEVKPDGTLGGIVPDTIEAVMKRMGVNELTGVVSTYDAMIPGLQANRWDLIGAGLYMNEERCKEILFAHPDTVTQAAFAVSPGNPHDIGSYRDVADDPDLRLIVLTGSFEENHARSLGIEGERLVSIPDVPSAVDALDAGRGDAFAANVPALEAVKSDKFDSVIVNDGPPTAGGVGFRLEDEAFRDAYDKAFDEIKANGTFERISAKYGFDGKLAIETTRKEVEPSCAK
jgi:polar amino acid transport system substrate-binding protein